MYKIDDQDILKRDFSKYQDNYTFFPYLLNNNNDRFGFKTLLYTIHNGESCILKKLRDNCFNFNFSPFHYV